MVAGRYRILGMLGKGGMGEVYRATDLTLGQSVALKFLIRGAANNEKWLERFHGEVRIARQISHPNVCRVYDIGEDDDVPFLSMEYVDGDDLATLLVGIGRLPAEKATEIARKICAGLAAAHDKGVIHRDLKPHNIMMTKRGEILITDFGLAAVADTLAGPEARNGTPAYMAPEQLRGSEVTKKSDIYALGLLLYELYTGRRPYTAKSVPELLGLQESQQMTSMTSIASDIDPAVEGIIKRCLNPDPAMRPASALAVAAALPGGDPLAAALAAGETPSPELLAASGKHDPVPLNRTLPVLALILAGLVASPFLVHREYLPSFSAFNMSPEVLEQKARDNAAILSYTERGVDSFSALRYSGGFLGWARKNWNQAKGWSNLFHSEPPMYLFFRQSPRLLIARPDGRVTDNRPPQIVSGQWQMEVDTLGRLRRFEAVPPQFEKDVLAATTGAVDPLPVFRAAGLDFSKFAEVAPQWTPRAAFDLRKAWRGVHPQIAELPVTVEVAWWRGKVMHVQLVWPWTKPTLMTEEPMTTRQIAGGVIGIVLGSSGLFFAIWLARRNLKLGRGDRQGAWRIAAVVFFLRALALPAEMHFVPSGESADLLMNNLALLAFNCGLLWLLYIALEPVIRARWPQSIVTWSRVLSKQFYDPVVGAHLLYGVGVGVLMYLLFVGAGATESESTPLPMSMEAAMSARDWIASLTNNATSAATTGMILMFLIFGLRYIARKEWLAAGVAGVLLAVRNVAQSDGDLTFLLPVMLAIYWGLMFVLIRVGMLATSVAVLTVNILLNNPATLDPQAWYTLPSYLRLAVLAGIAVYGFYASRGDGNQAETAV
ncbi:hypothetical protein F183_A33960 [Bryobacterales bacterium F-183]|nr:hypothetical protein F183_A33960 [Bryobacterales bacterium F-183]